MRPVSFSMLLMKRGLDLTRTAAEVLQVNVGLRCNQACRHCHLEAGPERVECMTLATMREVVDFARRGRFRTADITGGAPELNPDLPWLIRELSGFVPRIMLRSNLTALGESARSSLMEQCADLRVAIAASLPSVNETQTESVRGRGVWNRSIATLRELNALGYGRAGTGLDLHIVSNPAGAFLPPPQEQLERKFRRDLERKSGITFSSLYVFANVPLGRFRRWLLASGNYEQYMNRLAESFNPCTLDGLMCRSLVSVSWEGYLYDCDFNLAAGLYCGGRKVHVSEAAGAPGAGGAIVASEHCYACTSGSGFT